MFSLAAPPQGGHGAGSLTEHRHSWSWPAFSELLTNTPAGQMFVTKDTKLIYIQRKYYDNLNSLTQNRKRSGMCCRTGGFPDGDLMSLSRGTDEMIITSVGCFLFPLKARLFDLSLITFKHHKDFDCSSPSYIFPILNRQESNSLLFLMSSRLSPTRQLSPLRIFLSGSCSRDSKESRPHTFVYIVAVFTSFFFFIPVFLSKHSGRRRRIGRNISKGDRLVSEDTRVSSSHCHVEDEQLNVHSSNPNHEKP